MDNRWWILPSLFVCDFYQVFVHEFFWNLLNKPVCWQGRGYRNVLGASFTRRGWILRGYWSVCVLNAQAPIWIDHLTVDWRPLTLEASPVSDFFIQMKQLLLEQFKHSSSRSSNAYKLSRTDGMDEFSEDHFSEWEQQTRFLFVVCTRFVDHY